MVAISFFEICKDTLWHFTTSLQQDPRNFLPNHRNLMKTCENMQNQIILKVLKARADGPVQFWFIQQCFSEGAIWPPRANRVKKLYVLVFLRRSRGGARSKNKLNLSERSDWGGFSAFYGIEKILSVPKILTIQFFRPLTFLQECQGAIQAFSKLLFTIKSKFFGLEASNFAI